MPNLQSLLFFIPELVLTLTALVLVIASIVRVRNSTPAIIAAAGLVLAMIFASQQFFVGNPPLFWGLLVLDRPAVFFKMLFGIAALIIILMSETSASRIEAKGEYYALIVGSVLGMNLLATANNVLMIYLSLEFVSLTSYVLVGYARDSFRSTEASLKYVLYGAVASGVFIFGSSLYYGLTGTLDIVQLTALSRTPLFLIAGFFMLAGFLYKIAAVPMQAWCPDAYEGAPTPITAFLSVAPKAAGFAVLMRVFAEIGMSLNWAIIIAVISAITMTFGNLAAIPQNNIKRLLAYSSIAHAGYLLMGIACATAKGNEAVYFYFIAYLIMNLGAFIVVQMVAGDKQEGEDISAYAGLGRRSVQGVVVAISMTVFLLSLTGVPSFIGFIGKFYIFSAVIDAKLYWLAIIGIVNSVVSLYYYMRIVKAMFFSEASDPSLAPVFSRTLFVLIIVLALMTVLFGVYWQELGDVIRSVSF